MLLKKNVNASFTPDQEFIKIIKKELIVTLGKQNNDINFYVQPPAIFLIVGLNGSGKTTNVGKLDQFIKKNIKKYLSRRLISTDQLH